MKTGLIIYASSINQLTAFYTHVFGFKKIEGDSTYSLLIDGEFELVILETEVSKNSLDSFEPREITPLKPTFFIDLPP